MNASSRKNRTPCSTDMSSVCSLMPTMKRDQADQRFGELAELDAVIAARPNPASIIICSQ